MGTSTEKTKGERELDARVEELERIDERVSVAIAEAKAAARKIRSPRRDSEDESAQERLARRFGTSRTSFGMVVTGMTEAMDAAAAEEALQEIPGVTATVVYDTGRAWITAPDVVTPDQLIDVLDEQGLTAYLTRSSLRRRATRLDTKPRRRPAVPAAAQQLAADRTRRQEAALREASGGGEVLFTARELVTRLRFIVSLILTIPVIALSLYSKWQFDGWQFVVAGLSTVVVLWGAWPFHRAMVGALRRNMSALDEASAVAILGAWLWSMGQLVFTDARHFGFHNEPTWFAFNYDRSISGELFFDVACGVTVLLLGGRLLTRYNRVRSGALIRALRIPSDRVVTVVRKSGPSAKPRKRRVTISELNIGEDLLVPPGQIIPVDGAVIGGSSPVDASLVGGSPEPEEVKVGSKVWAGSVNHGATLKIRVHRTGSKTRAAMLLRWVRRAIREEDAAHQTAVRAASTLVPVALGLAVVAFGVWWLITGTPGGAFSVALSTLACVAPVALAMSTSIVLRLGILAGAHEGILLRNAETVRTLAEANAVMFNRVGTLTEGEMHVVTIAPAPGENPELVLRVAGALVMESDHPTSMAIVKACRQARDADSTSDGIPHWIEIRQATITDSGSFTGQVDIPVQHADGSVDLRTVEASIWRPRDLTALDERTAVAALSGGTPLVVSWRGKTRGVITVAQEVKPDAVDAVDELEAMGVDTIMITRDAYPVARRLADRLGISRVMAGVVPSQKAGAVRTIRSGGETVVMVGGADVSDSLRVADIGLLMDDDDSAATRDLNSTDVVSLRKTVCSVPQAIVLARKIRATMDSNILIAWIYNVVALVASVCGLLPPLMAAVSMVAAGLWIEWRSRWMQRRRLAPLSGPSLPWGS
ncbi:HAD-IC family P-type ATPase [Corynebacterium sp. TAE3-ERU12]|uniref:heavy metal translocating P-type ATPase n=1 Tax=Corynebacterium sp. TAE3-ERU12 TaxID=2849491 RepID=UPI001C47A74A|nr:HAD-IC family P-type ATPase [Corynebacterium sp. TAE3-ERU12]MBV7294549.1 HAD-IC family P-type ATPase [Corynebacterium sp. TAE3-ERU12]